MPSFSRLPFPPQSRGGDNVAEAGRVVRLREIQLGRSGREKRPLPKGKPRSANKRAVTRRRTAYMRQIPLINCGEGEQRPR